MSIIIVEGVDRVGKTTFCKKLADILRYPIFKANDKILVQDRKMVDLKFEAILQIFECNQKGIMGNRMIIDRFHLTEMVYNNARGEKFDTYFDVDRRLAEVGAHLIFVQSEDIKKSSEEHGKDLEELELYMQLLFNASAIKEKVTISYKHFDLLSDVVFTKESKVLADLAYKTLCDIEKEQEYKYNKDDKKISCYCFKCRRKRGEI